MKFLSKNFIRYPGSYIYKSNKSETCHITIHQKHVNSETKNMSSKSPILRFLGLLNSTQKISLCIAFFFALIQGALLPCLMILLGDVTESVMNYNIILNCDTKFENCTNQSPKSIDLNEKEFQEFLDPISKTKTEVVIMIIFGCVNFICGFIHNYIMMNMSKNLTENMRKNFFKSLMKRDLTYFETKVSTQQASIILLKDFATIEEGLGSKITMIVKNVAQVLTGIIVGFLYSYSVTLVILAFLPFMNICLSYGIKNIQVTSNKGEENFQASSDIASEAIDAIKTIKAFGLQKYILIKFDKEIYKTAENRKHGAKIQGISFGLLFSLRVQLPTELFLRFLYVHPLAEKIATGI